MDAFPYVCPHCGTRQFVSLGNGFARDSHFNDLLVSGIPGSPQLRSPHVGTKVSVYVCSRCREPSISVEIALKHKDTAIAAGDRVHIIPGKSIKTYINSRIYPQYSTPMVHPSVPTVLAEDYKEAWPILDQSPKSSAVLARRCVQGAIRDFCGIAKRTLNQEIDELERRYETGSLGPLAPYVSHDLIEAIDNIRKVGNIGAHMEKNVDKMVAIDPDEAKLLLTLVRILFTEWYQAKSEREARLQNLSTIASEKAAAKETPPSSPPEDASEADPTSSAVS